jgi:insertion element IS1 protein InsB
MDTCLLLPECTCTTKTCNTCNGATIKHGYAKKGDQRLRCKCCGKTQVNNYHYNAYKPNVNKLIIQFTKEGLGIRSTARILKISATTLLKRLLYIATNIPRPLISQYKTYEVDELCTYIKQKSRLIWVVYALERNTKTVVSFNVGSRTSKTLSIVTQTLINAKAKAIYTDRLRQYASLIPKEFHHRKQFGTNHIERYNLSLRTHLKRLVRRSICFSKSKSMLSAVLKIYFWA